MKTRTLVASLCAAAFLLAPLSPASVRGDDTTPIMPLPEIQAGMKGEWHTVVSGVRIDSFPMEVVGVVENFIGPRRPVIICRGLDATNRLTGP
jgi:hypothetical protein